MRFANIPRNGEYELYFSIFLFFDVFEALQQAFSFVHFFCLPKRNEPKKRAPLCDRSAAQGLALRELRRVLLNAVALVLRLCLEQRLGIGILYSYFRD